MRAADQATDAKLVHRTRDHSAMSLQQQSGHGPGGSRREFIRHTVDVPLEVEDLGTNGPRLERSRNVSFGGLAFRTEVCPRIGALLQLRMPTVDPPFVAEVRVAWCRPEDGAYLVGARFVDAAAAFRSRMVQQVCAIEKYRREVREGEGRTLSSQEAAAEWIERYAGRFPGNAVDEDDGDEEDAA